MVPLTTIDWSKKARFLLVFCKELAPRLLAFGGAVEV